MLVEKKSGNLLKAPQHIQHWIFFLFGKRAAEVKNIIMNTLNWSGIHCEYIIKLKEDEFDLKDKNFAAVDYKNLEALLVDDPIQSILKLAENFLSVENRLHIIFYITCNSFLSRHEKKFLWKAVIGDEKWVC